MSTSKLPADVEAACRQEFRECELDAFVEPFLLAVEPTISCDVHGDEEGNRTLAKPRPGGTKIGGFPHLPPALSWPMFSGKYLPFIAQVNLAELPAFAGDPLPSDGILYYFYWATNEVKDEPVAVLYLSDSDGALQPCEVDVSQIHVDWQGEALYEEEFADKFSLSVTFSPNVAEACARDQGLLGEGESIDDLEGDFPDEFAQSVDILLEYGLDVWEKEEYAEEGITLTHSTLIQLLGYPDPCDYFLYPLRTTRGGHTDGIDRWQNILSVGSCNNMLWSDVGSLGFFIRDDDLAQRDFRRVTASIMSS